MRSLGTLSRIHSALFAFLCVFAAACGDGGGHDPAGLNLSQLLGVYDVTVAGVPAVQGSSAIGVVKRNQNADATIHIDANIFDAIDVDVTEDVNGSLTLDGSRIDGVDEVVPITGTATVDSSQPDRRISGTIEDDLSEQQTFIMVGASSGTPASLAGSYVFSFVPSPSGCDCSSVTTLALTVNRDGGGALAMGTDTNAAGTIVGTLSAGTCVISPTGRLRCVGTYHPVEPGSADVSESIVLQGALPSGSTNAGNGEYLRGSPPGAFVTGQWSVVAAP